MNREEVIEVVKKLHGSLSPGIALGIRMSEIALDKIDASKVENKDLIAVSESSQCLADAMQAVTGCTMGHGNALVKHFGKLALTLVRADTGMGVRVMLKEDAMTTSSTLKRWIMRESKLSGEETRKLAGLLLDLEDRFFRVQSIQADIKPILGEADVVSDVVRCSSCRELVSSSRARVEERILCRACDGEKYNVVQDH